MTAILFNGLDLDMATANTDEGWRLQARVEGTDWGNGEPVLASIASQLQDGDLEILSRWGNREVSIEVRIDAPGSDTPGAALALGQKALERACQFDGWAELVLLSDLAGSEESVVEVVSATAALVTNFADEYTLGQRTYVLTLRARPFVRPSDRETFDAPAAVGSTTTTVDDGSSTTGWSLLTSSPGAVTNLETNPDFASNVTGYSAGTGTAAVNFATESGRSTASVGTGTTFSQTSYVNGPLEVVTAGSTVLIGSIVSTAASHAGNFMQTGAKVRFYSDTGGTVQIGSDTELVTAGGDWVTRTWTVTVPATAVRMRVYRSQKQLATATSSPWWIDKQWTIHTPSGSVMPGSGYWDGATTDTAAVTYAWTGTANNSTSTATWSTAALTSPGAIVVKGIVYGRSSVSIRRTGTVTMSSLNYMRIRGTASAYSDGQVTVADNGGAAIATTSYSYNQTTGAFEILLNRPTGFTTVDVGFSRTGGGISLTDGVFVSVDSIEITDNPFASGKVQTRQIDITGSQRTELSLSVLGLDTAGTTPVSLGEQVLIHTAAKSSDGRAKFLALRSNSGVTGTSDATATSGAYNTLNTTGTPTNHTFAASLLLPGNYLLVARVMPTTTGPKVLSFRGYVDPTTGDNAYDPPGGTTWKTCPLAIGTTWPAIAQNAWGMIPLGVLRLPPADLEDSAATLTIQIAADTNSVVRLDDVFLLNADIGQTTLVRTDISGGSFSAVRIDAATVDSPSPSVWVGVANGTMLADWARLQAFEQHLAAPDLLQVSSVTPGCSTSRLAGSYFRRYSNAVAPQ